jgi:hypothetical protein
MSSKEEKTPDPVERLKEELAIKLNAVVDKIAAEQGTTREEVLRFVKDFLEAHAPRK